MSTCYMNPLLFKTTADYERQLPNLLFLMVGAFRKATNNKLMRAKVP